MHIIELRPTRTRTIIGLICLVFTLLVFLVIAVACLMPGEQGRSYGGFLVCAALFCLFAWGFGRVLKQLRNPNARVVLDDEGVTDRTMPTPKFLWRSVSMAQTIQQRRFGIPVSTFVRLDVSDEAERIERLSTKDRKLVAMNRGMGYGAFFVNLSALPMSGTEFFREMNQRRAQLGLPALIDGIHSAVPAVLQ